ncbi:MAG: LPS export ABC transporter permease LptG [Gammaproteobacteria bacterium]|nr:LPS export ABC transporter permease LptG [Gammaproteobacteria bacterium]
MKLVDRYIIKTVLQSTALTLFVLVALTLLFRFISELGDMDDQYNLLEIMVFLLMSAPGFVYDFLPMSVLLGSMLGMGALASNNELTVLHVTGMSYSRLVLSVSKAGLVLVFLVVVLGEVVVPQSRLAATNYQLQAKDREAGMQVSGGFWARDGNTVIHVERALSKNQLAGVTRYEFDVNERLTQVQTIRHAVQNKDSWNLFDISTRMIRPESVKLSTAKQGTAESLVNPELLKLLTIEPNHMSVFGLQGYLDYLDENGLYDYVFEYEYWVRLFNPLVILVMLLLGLPFVFSAQRDVGSGQRIMIGIIIGIAFFLLNQVTGHLGRVYEIKPVLSALLPLLLFASASLYGLSRIGLR